MPSGGFRRVHRFTGILAIAALLLAAGCAGRIGSHPGALAERYAAAGRLDDAVREIDLAVRSHPRNAEVRMQASAIHRKAGHRSAAITHLEAAIQLAPGNAEVWLALGELENERENVADAYVAYRRAAELAPEEIRAVAGLALAADNLGFEDEARDAYARWAELERKQRDNEPPSGAN
jgi:tetratricopeptide (TPR) repeat protein